jgi:hypothetical protein
MIEGHLTEGALAEIASTIDDQLKEVTAQGAEWRTRGSGAAGRALRKQKRAISRITGQSSDSFITRFRAAARADLCEEGGHLHTLQNRWLNPTKPEVIRSMCALLAGMGVGGNLVPILVVPLLVIILHLGVKAFCELPPKR